MLDYYYQLDLRLLTFIKKFYYLKELRLLEVLALAKKLKVAIVKAEK